MGIDFDIKLELLKEYDLDLSWYETEETRQDIEDGTYITFCAKVTASLEGIELASTYLGQCVYRNEQEFIDSGYYEDMVETVKDEAYDVLAKMAGIWVQGIIRATI